MEIFKTTNNEYEFTLTMGHNGVFFEVQGAKPFARKWVEVLRDLTENGDGLFAPEQIDYALLVCLHQCEEHGAKIFLHDEDESECIDFATLFALVNVPSENEDETETTIEFNPNF
ncbi:MAG: hypothetical protein II834_00540 [Bacteroidaceae bacterium]|nr:hypothetical protein [Bacteroidaceae bacterium]